MPDRATAQDVVAEVFLTAWRQRRELPPEPLTRLWLTRVAYRAVSNARRSARRAGMLTLRLARQGPDPVLDLYGAPVPASVQQVRAALERLAEPDREVLRLALWEQLTLAEIAQILDVTPNTAGVRLHRARQQLPPPQPPPVNAARVLNPTNGRRP